MRKFSVFLIVVFSVVPLIAKAQPALDQDQTRLLNRILSVLQVYPDFASDACIEALQELRSNEKRVARQGSQGLRQNEFLMRDVLQSDFAETVEVCGTDARTLCRTQSVSHPRLRPLCVFLRAPTQRKT